MIIPLLLLTFLHQSIGHVALIFPPARKYDLDFLDSFRTSGACGGMPKGDIVTTIPNNQKINIEWHLGYAHGGGYKIEMINEQGDVQKDFTNGFVGTEGENKFTTNFEIDIPSDLEGKKIIRLIRHAKEWGAKYLFHSCADVEFVKLSNYQNDCSGHGTASGSTCTCDKFYTGDKCQYVQDCHDNSDCNNRGECIENSGTVQPKKECYCSIGNFGKNCEKESPIKTKSYNSSLYKTEEFQGGDFKFLYRFVDATTMEGIIVAKTANYVAIGWRDSETKTTSCQKFPSDVQPPKYSAGGKKLHPMDCQDMIIGRARGDSSNIGDFYTRDRSTPRRDEVYGGKDDLTAAAGWEEDGVTTIIFQRLVDTDDADTDNDFSAQLTFIWAYGQAGDGFYNDDELKYHGNPSLLAGKVTRGKKGITIASNSNFCPGDCESKTAKTAGLSEQRTLALVAGILLIILMGIQLVQNFSEGMTCSGKSPSKPGVTSHQPMYMQRLD